MRLVEVGPRDGLQNEKAMVPTDIKVALIDLLTDAGLPCDRGDVVRVAEMGAADGRRGRRDGAHPPPAGVTYPVLTPNMKGFEGALAAKADEVVVFVAATEAFSQKNINCSIAESLERVAPVFAAAKANGIRVRGYISCVLGCPYEGDVDPARVRDVADALYRDRIVRGVARRHDRRRHRRQDQALFAMVAERVPMSALAGHFHDTYGQALANVYAALEMGVATFDCSVAGLGGCPYAKGATGNVASEDVVYLLDGFGIDTGIDMTRLRIAGQFISDFLGRPPVSRVARALDAKAPLAATWSRRPGERIGAAEGAGADVPSPCISVCALDARGQLCAGCFRTLDEIAAWSVLDAPTSARWSPRSRARRAGGATDHANR